MNGFEKPSASRRGHQRTDAMYLLSCACLSFVVLCCVLGAFSQQYDATLTQRFGLGVLGIGCVARVLSIWSAGSVSSDWFMVHGGMAVVAAGTLCRVLYGPRSAPTANTYEAR